MSRADGVGSTKSKFPVYAHFVEGGKKYTVYEDGLGGGVYLFRSSEGNVTSHMVRGENSTEESINIMSRIDGGIFKICLGDFGKINVRET